MVNTDANQTEQHSFSDSPLPGSKELKLFERLKTRYDDMKNRKSPFIVLHDVLARFILGRTNFSNSQKDIQPGDYFDNLLFDDTAPSANMLMSSSHVGALWPNGARSFRITLPLEMRKELEDDDEIKKYYEYVTQKLAESMDNPKSGFLTSFEEYMTEISALGTSAIFVEENDDISVPAIYRSISIRDLFIDAGPNGNVDTVYIRKFMTTLEMYKEYGEDSLTSGELATIKAGQTDKAKHEIVQAIEPRLEINGDSYSNKDMPYMSCHFDLTSNRLIKESGFKQLPIFVGRFWHSLNELYGRCPGEKALPSIREAQELRFDLILAFEQMLKPPLGMLEGSVLGDEVDLSPNGINIVSVNGKMGNIDPSKSIWPIFQPGNPQNAVARLTELTEIIKNHFFLDRIMDLNNEQRMTLGETNIRNGLRGQSLNTFYSRQEKEILEPAIERTFDIHLSKGLLGLPKQDPRVQELQDEGIESFTIPDELVKRMVQGEDIYRIEFISPASRIKNNEEATGTMESLTVVQNIAAVNPEVLDIVDFEAALRKLFELKGTSSTLLRSQESINKIRNDRAQAQQEQMQAQQAMQETQAVKNVASANKDAGATQNGG